MGPILILILFAAFLLFGGFRVIQQYQQGLLFRLGRCVGIRGAGLTWIIPMVDRLQIVDTRVITRDIEPQETMTQDNVPVKVNAVIWYRVVDTQRAILEVANYSQAVVQTSLTTLRNVLGQHSLDELLKERDKLSTMLQSVMDSVTEPWGIKVERVEVKDVEIPASMQRAMAQEAEALREKRARLIKADAEVGAAVRLREAAEQVARSPVALELRRMQMISEVGAEQNTTTIIMMPSEFVSAAGALARLVPASAVPAPAATPAPAGDETPPAEPLP